MLIWLDWIILVILVVSAFLGLRKGLVRMAFGVLAMLGASWLSSARLAPVTALLKNFFSMPDIALTVIAFILLWLLAFFSVHLIGKMISKSIRLTPLGLVDRGGGAVFGFLQSGLIMLVVLILLMSVPMVNEKVSPTISGSLFLSWCQPMIEWGHTFFESKLPKELKSPFPGMPGMPEMPNIPGAPTGSMKLPSLKNLSI